MQTEVTMPFRPIILLQVTRRDLKRKFMPMGSAMSGSFLSTIILEGYGQEMSGKICMKRSIRFKTEATMAGITWKVFIAIHPEISVAILLDLFLHYGNIHI